MIPFVTKLAGGDLAGFILVLARVTPLFLLAPMFSSKALPAQARTLLAIGIAVGLTPIALRGQHIPSDAFALGALVVEGMLVGLGFAFAIAALFAVLETAASFIDLLSGLSFGSMINPVLGMESGAFSALYGMLGLLVFLTIGGEEWVLRGIARSFSLVPISAAPRLVALAGGAENAFASIFTSAVEVAGPVMLTMLITDVAFGVLARVAPQMNVFAVGFSLKIGVAVLLVMATLPFVANWLGEQLSLSVGAALGSLRAT